MPTSVCPKLDRESLLVTVLSAALKAVFTALFADVTSFPSFNLDCS